MKIVAVNGRRFSIDELKRAIARVEDVDDAAGVHRRERQLLQDRDASTITAGCGIRTSSASTGKDDVLTQIAAPRVK